MGKKKIYSLCTQGVLFSPKEECHAPIWDWKALSEMNRLRRAIMHVLSHVRKLSKMDLNAEQ